MLWTQLPYTINNYLELICISVSEYLFIIFIQFSCTFELLINNPNKLVLRLNDKHNAGAFGHVASPGGGAILCYPGGWVFAYPGNLTSVFSKSVMEEFIGKDEAIVKVCPVRKGLNKLLDVFRGMSSQF